MQIPARFVVLYEIETNWKLLKLVQGQVFLAKLYKAFCPPAPNSIETVDRKLEED